MKKIFIAVIIMLLIHCPSFAENTLQAGIKKSTIAKIDKTFIEFEDENIEIARNKKFLGDIEDTNKVGYIYSITNKRTTPIIVKKITCPDRIEYVKSYYYAGYGSPSILAFTVISGTSSMLAINNAKNYLKPLPQNYTINPNSTTQVLFLAKKYIEPRVKFEFEINGHLKEINSKSTYIVKDTKYYKVLLDSQNCLNGYFGFNGIVNKREIPLVEAYLKSGTLEKNELSMASSLLNVINYEVNHNALGGDKCDVTRPYVTEENTKIIELLLQAGANPNAENVKPLMFQAMRTKNAKIINLLLAYGANPNIKYMGRYPAYQAIIYNQPEILKLLLDAGADPNARVNGKTLLYWSIKKKHLEMAKLLINKKETVKNLINAGATIDKDSIKYAKKSKDENIKKLILFQSK